MRGTHLFLVLAANGSLDAMDVAKRALNAPHYVEGSGGGEWVAELSCSWPSFALNPSLIFFFCVAGLRRTYLVRASHQKFTILTVRKHCRGNGIERMHVHLHERAPAMLFFA